MNMHETGEGMPCKAVKFQTVYCFWNSISGEFARGVASDAGSPVLELPVGSVGSRPWCDTGEKPLPPQSSPRALRGFLDKG